MEPTPSLTEVIVREIVARGPMGFERFMDLALYHPELGYYERKQETVGRRGDYYTSVSVGPLFGELLAARFGEWLATCGGDPCLVEAGAHQGHLARDILRWLERWQPGLAKRVWYCIVEPSPRRREWQRHALADLAPRVRWAGSWEELQAGTGSAGLRGILFSNELLDAFPVRRLQWDAAARGWIELGVAVHEGRLAWTRLEPGSPATGGSAHPFPEVPVELRAAVPDGFILDESPRAAAWWRQAALALREGWLLTFDYGLSTPAICSPERLTGTLRAYSRHHLSDDLLAQPGEQDLTAHVDFPALRAAGEAAGLETEWFDTQARFLTGIASGIWEGRVPFGSWTPKQTRQFLTLTHPEHLGNRFRVLIQRRV